MFNISTVINEILGVCLPPATTRWVGVLQVAGFLRLACIEGKIIFHKLPEKLSKVLVTIHLWLSRSDVSLPRQSICVCILVVWSTYFLVMCMNKRPDLEKSKRSFHEPQLLHQLLPCHLVLAVLVAMLVS